MFDTIESNGELIVTKYNGSDTIITIPSKINGKIVTSIGDKAFQGNESLTSITIPDSVTTIGNSAFDGCESLVSITIPNSVTFIGDYAFDYCTSLTSIIVEKGNTKYDSRNNCNAIIETKTNKLILGCSETIIPKNITSIGKYAFSSCRNLWSIVIPNKVKSIGEYAFYGCGNLEDIIIPKSVKYIGESAFDSCENLTNVIFKKCKGWKVCNDRKSSLISILSRDLSSTLITARYLTRTYCDYEWSRS